MGHFGTLWFVNVRAGDVLCVLKVNKYIKKTNCRKNIRVTRMPKSTQTKHCKI